MSKASKKRQKLTQEELKAENKKLRNDYYSVVDRLADVTEAYRELKGKTNG